MGAVFLFGGIIVLKKEVDDHMPNHIFINRESGNDNISIFYDEPSFVVIANKDDLASIQLIDESKKTGIYLLLGDDKRYIGQASNAIFNRLQQHYINKPWWIIRVSKNAQSKKPETVPRYWQFQGALSYFTYLAVVKNLVHE